MNSSDNGLAGKVITGTGLETIPRFYSHGLEEIAPRGDRYDLPAEELEAMIAETLAHVVSGTPADWRGLIGRLEANPAIESSDCNWNVKPIGTPDERQAVELVAAVVRKKYPRAKPIKPDEPMFAGF